MLRAHCSCMLVPAPQVVFREAAGRRWLDPTLAEWPENDFRIFVGDLGNEVNDEALGKAFQRYPSFAKAKVCACWGCSAVTVRSAPAGGSGHDMPVCVVTWLYVPSSSTFLGVCYQRSRSVAPVLLRSALQALTHVTSHVTCDVALQTHIDNSSLVVSPTPALFSLVASAASWPWPCVLATRTICGDLQGTGLLNAAYGCKHALMLQWDTHLQCSSTVGSPPAVLLCAQIIRDKRTNKSKGFGIVSLLDGNDFAKALKEMNGKYIGNRPCKLSKSTWNERSRPVGGGAAAGGGGGKRKDAPGGGGQGAQKTQKLGPKAKYHVPILRQP